MEALPRATHQSSLAERPGVRRTRRDSTAIEVNVNSCNYTPGSRRICPIRPPTWLTRLAAIHDIAAVVTDLRPRSKPIPSRGDIAGYHHCGLTRSQPGAIACPANLRISFFIMKAFSYVLCASTPWEVRSSRLKGLILTSFRTGIA